MNTMKLHGLNTMEQYALISQNVGMIKFAMENSFNDENWDKHDNQLSTNHIEKLNLIASQFYPLAEVQLTITD